MTSGTARGLIVSLGEIVVEIIAEQRGNGFREPLRLRGPFASGAPAIFIDQVAKLGHPAGLISCVGDDDFGWLNIERLRQDGADTSAIQVHSDRVTGSAFVRYREDGERDFVFNIKASAAGCTQIGPAARALLERCQHLHVMGSSLFSPALVEAAMEAIERVKRGGGTVSFDPNMRKELLSAPGMKAALEAVLRQCDMFLPSGPELTLLTRAEVEADAIAELLGRGVSSIVVKQGSAGASHYSAAGAVHRAAYPATEIDPTGAGDCFGATFVTCWLQGRSVEDCLRYACASGAIAVGVVGPMQGTSSFAELDAFIARAGSGE